ncbi:MAG: trypsin-like peptidase domain-containing protein [Clostridia bacterium]|nr:trypsin-like peptidase domain-containing protein [Clostridia bacterium]
MDYQNFNFQDQNSPNQAGNEYSLYRVSYEEPIVMVQESSKKKKNRGMAVLLAFVIGVGATSVASFFALPKLVEREVAKLPGSSYSLNVPPNPSMTAEQGGATQVANKQLLSVVEIARKVGPTVVGINTKVAMQNFFGMPTMQDGSGSGIIISSDGYVVTNNHVIEGASEIKVLLSDGKEFEAKLVGADARTDLAVLKMEGLNFPYATLGNSSELQVGELAVAIGNPLGNELAGSVTGGYISALNRSITVDDRKFNLIQTDAAINPGNSGGALVNNYGEVIGINSVKMSASGVEGIGFAIPIDEAKPIIEDLKNGGYVKGRPVIGIAGRNVTKQDSEYYGIPVGVYVLELTPYSAAEKAGIKTSDVITEIDGVKIETIDELNTEKEKHKAGDSVTLTVIRGEDTIKVKLTLQEEKPTTQVN